MRVSNLWIAIVLFAWSAAGPAQELILTNPLGVDRSQEVIEVPLARILQHLHLPLSQAAYLVAEDAVTGQRIPDQLCAAGQNAAPACLLLLVQLSAHGRQRIVFRADAAATRPAVLVFGREAPERKDDFAWENQQAAYRIYGPALQATGEITSGIDVWSKRVPNLVIDNFYKRDADGARTHDPALSYHRDNGQGLDSYYVGPSRGCGGTAVFSGGKLIVSKNYTTLHIVDNGPIRFSFEVSYAPWDANGVAVSETRRITLDAGTHMNKIVSTYTFQGAATLHLAAGIAVHEGAEAKLPVTGGIASVWDTPQDPSAGRIATGMISDPRQHARTVEAAGHVVMVFTRHSGEPFTYFAGSGWSKADMPSFTDWNRYLQLQLDLIVHPVLIRWSER